MSVFITQILTFEFCIFKFYHSSFYNIELLILYYPINIVNILFFTLKPNVSLFYMLHICQHIHAHYMLQFAYYYYYWHNFQIYHDLIFLLIMDLGFPASFCAQKFLIEIQLLKKIKKK